MAKTRTLVAEVDGVKYTKRTACNYRYFWVCDTILPSGGVMKNAACGWSCKPVDKDGRHPSWSATWIYANTRCVPLASDQGETTVEKEKVEMTKQTQTKEEDASVYVLPRDIDRLCPSIGEVAYVDAYGDGVSRLMPLKSITPRYIGFLAVDKTGWVEVKVKRVWNNEGANFLCWRDRTGRLHCQYVDEMP